MSDTLTDTERAAVLRIVEEMEAHADDPTEVDGVVGPIFDSGYKCAAGTYARALRKVLGEW